MTFPFLSLPGEIRNKIYDDLLFPCGHRIYNYHQGLFLRKPPAKDLRLYSPHANRYGSIEKKIWFFTPRICFFPLLLLNRQVYDEAHDYFWANATFVFGTYWGEYLPWPTLSMMAQKACGERIEKMEVNDAHELTWYSDRLEEKLHPRWRWSNIKEVTLTIPRIDKLAAERDSSARDPVGDLTWRNHFKDLMDLAGANYNTPFKSYFLVKLPIFFPFVVRPSRVFSDSRGIYCREKIRVTMKELHMAWGTKLLVENPSGPREPPLVVWNEGQLNENSKDLAVTAICERCVQYHNAFDEALDNLG